MHIIEYTADTRQKIRLIRLYLNPGAHETHDGVAVAGSHDVDLAQKAAQVRL